MNFSEKLKFEHEDEIIKPGKKNLANMVIDGDLDCANIMANGSQEGRVSDKKNYYDSRVHRLASIIRIFAGISTAGKSPLFSVCSNNSTSVP